MSKKRLNILLSILIAVMFIYEYMSGGFHKLYIQTLMMKHGIVVVMYSAEWCPTCRTVKPILSCLDKVGAIKLLLADVDSEEEKMYGAAVEYIPQVSVFKTINDGTSGLTYHGFFPLSKEEFSSYILEETTVNKEVFDVCLGDLYKKTGA